MDQLSWLDLPFTFISIESIPNHQPEPQSPPRKRSLIAPLDQAPAIFSVLSRIPVGDCVPPHIYISDYQDGGVIPEWIVWTRKRGKRIQILTLVDKDTINENMFGHMEGIACEVFTAPAKTLKAPEYLWTPDPHCKKRRDKLCDIRQMARAMNDRRRRNNTQEERADDLDNRGNPSQSARSS